MLIAIVVASGEGGGEVDLVYKELTKLFEYQKLEKTKKVATQHETIF